MGAEIFYQCEPCEFIMVVDIDAVMTRTLYRAEHVDMAPNVVINIKIKDFLCNRRVSAFE